LLKHPWIAIIAGNDRRKQMANKEHLEVLIQGTDVWNAWREQHPEILPDLSETPAIRRTFTITTIRADLSGANLSGANLSRAILEEVDLSDADLSGANLRGADLSGADLSGADLSGAKLSGADLSDADLSGANLRGADLDQAILRAVTLGQATLYEATLRAANLSGADLSHANLWGANLWGANLWGANLSGADLSEAILIGANLSRVDLSSANLSGATLLGTNLTKATLTECHIYGISAWDVALIGATQNSLVITPEDQPIITVDNLQIAQFLYLLLDNQEIRDVISTTKVVLILGRFTPERKAVLDALRNILHTKDYVPIMFDFDKPANIDTQETITALARLARFVIADITEAKNIPQELVSIVETHPSLAIQPLLQHDSEPWGMYDHIKRYPWVLPLHRYIDLADLLATLEERVIDPAEHKAQELTRP
jgi:uncharacterized protein YjbI with pentapeptide repeats